MTQTDKEARLGRAVTEMAELRQELRIIELGIRHVASLFDRVGPLLRVTPEDARELLREELPSKEALMTDLDRMAVIKDRQAELKYLLREFGIDSI